MEDQVILGRCIVKIREATIVGKSILRSCMCGVIWVGLAVGAAGQTLPASPHQGPNQLKAVAIRIESPEPNERSVKGDKLLYVSVTAADEVFLGDKKYALDKLGAELKAAHDKMPNQRVFLRGDVSMSYGRFMQVMGVIVGAGFSQLALVGQ